MYLAPYRTVSTRSVEIIQETQKSYADVRFKSPPRESPIFLRVVIGMLVDLGLRGRRLGSQIYTRRVWR